MTTTTTTPTYVALTDAGTKHWHLGSVERGEVCYCGTRLMTPGDTRKFALKVPAAERGFQTDTALDCINCGACKRNREYGYATGATTRPATVPAPRRGRTPSAGDAVTRVPGARPDDADQLARTITRRRPQHARTVTATEAADLANGAAEAAADHAARPSRRRSRADRAHEQQLADAARREALTTSADATLAAIEAAVADATGEPPVTTPEPVGMANPEVAAAVEADVAAAAQRRRGERPMSRTAKAKALVESGECANLRDARAYLADMGE